MSASIYAVNQVCATESTYVQPNLGIFDNDSLYGPAATNNNRFDYISRDRTSYFSPSYDEDYRELAPPNDVLLMNFPRQDMDNSNLVDICLGLEASVMEPEPSVEIIEQPAKWAPKFRYMNETGRYPGAITGDNSTADKKTYPTIRINNIRGSAVVVVSCVTSEEPHRVHPHGLVAREDCTDKKSPGIFTIRLDADLIDSTTNSITKEFKGLGIECARRRDIEKSLKTREKIQVDPFGLGYEHRDDTSTINLNEVRLCFQVFIEGSQAGVFDRPLPACVTEPFRNVKNQSKLVIKRLSHSSVEASGGTEIIVLTEKFDPTDIRVRFYEEQGGTVVWNTTVDITTDNVHGTSALYFPTPKYRDGYVEQNVMAWIQLERKYDGQRSEPCKIMFYACQTDNQLIEHKKRKLQRLSSIPSNQEPYTHQPEGLPQYWPTYTDDPFLAAPPQSDYWTELL